MNPRSLPPLPQNASPAHQTVVRMRSPGEIVSAVPFLLGFAPQDSLVLIALRDKRLGLTCRVDLADTANDEAVAMVVAAVRRDEATSVVLVAFGTDRAETAPALVRMRRELLDAGLDIREELSVVQGRWFHAACPEARCCPSEGTPVVDHDHAPSTLALSAATGGYLSSREDIVAMCSPDRTLLVAAVRSEIDHLCASMHEGALSPDQSAADMLAVLGWSGDDAPSAAQLARAASETLEPAMRDVWYAVVAPGMMRGTRPDLIEVHQQVAATGRERGDLDDAGILVDGAARDRVLGRLLQWVRHLPDDRPEFVMGPLVIAAMARWCAGDGAYARVLVERAHALGIPPLGMLQTLTVLLEHGVRDPQFGWLAPDFAAARAPRARSGGRRRGPRRGRPPRGGPTRAA